ncbi:MAG: hypothetical protein AVDCRST_MAG08-1900, partial [uncultured Acetobacteraceae bacterium]
CSSRSRASSASPTGGSPPPRSSTTCLTTTACCRPSSGRSWTARRVSRSCPASSISGAARSKGRCTQCESRLRRWSGRRSCATRTGSSAST